MSTKMPTLDSLIAGISGAVVHAQKLVESAQLNNLTKYFHCKKSDGSDGTDDSYVFSPRTLRIDLPSHRPDAKPGETDAYHVPYFSIVPHTALHIKQVDIELDVGLSTLCESEETSSSDRQNTHAEDSSNTDDVLPDDKFAHLVVDMRSLTRSKGLSAHIKLTVEAAELPESTARLINELIKTTQVYEHKKQHEDADQDKTKES